MCYKMELEGKRNRIFALIKKNWVLLGVLFLLFAMSCNKPTFEIKGELPNSKFDGEWIFLVPMEEHTVKDVDSVLIENSSFAFHGNIERVAIIRARIALRLRLQELLVVTEPGKIEVKLDSISSGGGTVQNDALERWKTYRAETYTTLVKAKESAKNDTTNTLETDAIIEKIKNESKDFNYKILKEMGDNTLGNFLHNKVRVAIPEDKKEEIDSLFKTN